MKAAYTYLLVGMLFFCHQVMGQTTPMYSQYMFNMLNINPAYAGNKAEANFTGIYRNQWVQVEGAPKTVSVSFDKRVSERIWGYGVQLYNDRIGSKSITGGTLTLACHLPLNEEDATLSIGLNAGLANYQANYATNRVIDPIDPLLNTNINGLGPLAGLGFLFHTSKAYASLSFPTLLKKHFNADNSVSVNSFLNNNDIFFTAGFVSGTEDDPVRFKPSFLIKYNSTVGAQVDVSLNVWLGDGFSTGFSYRNRESVLGMVSFGLTNDIHLGYGYDYTISNLINFSRGSHELMIRYNIDGFLKKGKSTSFRFY